MRKKLSKLKNMKFIQNVVVLISGTAAAQLVTMLFSPIISRLYGPEAFGILGVFTSMVGILSPIAALTYPIAIVLPRKDSEAKGLVRLSILISGLLSTIIALILIIFQKPLVKMFQIEEIASYLYLIPFVIFFSGLLQVMQQWLIRTKQFRVTAKTTFYSVLILNSAKAGIGIFNPVASILLIISALGSALQSIMLGIGALRTISPISKEKDNEISLKSLARTYRDFPLFRAPEAFINAISHSLPVLLLSSFFSPVSAGFYTLSITVLSKPSQLISESVGNVFYPRIAEAANKKENVTSLIIRATLALAALGIVPFGTIVLFGPWIFGFVFGGDWVVAGEYARWVAIWSFTMFINKPSIKALPVLSAQLFHLKFTSIVSVTRVITLGVGYFIFNNDIIAIALFGILGSLTNIILIIITLNKSKKFDFTQKNM